MDLETKKVYKTKKSNSLFLSLFFLVFSVLLTAGIYFYNVSIINENSNFDKIIETKESSISELEKDSKVIISLLYNSNKSSIRKLENYSNITLFINHILKLSRVYKINFKGFNYSTGELGLLVVASSDSSGKINYKKVSKFISEYRKNENKQALFDLGLVKSISTKNKGVDNVFNINLSLKNNVNKILENIKKIESENKEKLRLEEERKKEFEKKKEMLLEKRNKESINSGSTIEEK